MKKLLFVVLALALTSGLILTPAPARAAGKTEILIGAINSMTGGEAMVGNEHRWAYQQAVKDINAKGGVYVKDVGKKLPIEARSWRTIRATPPGPEPPPKSSSSWTRWTFSWAPSIPRSILTLPPWPRSTRSSLSPPPSSRRISRSRSLVGLWTRSSPLPSWGIAQRHALDPIPAAERPKNFCVLVEDNQDGQSFNKFGAAPVLRKV